MDTQTTPKSDSASNLTALEACAFALTAARGLSDSGKLHALPLVSLDASRQALLEYFENGWALTEVLFSGIATEAALYARPIHQLRHPLIFYYAHPAALYVNKLRVAGVLDQAVNARFELLFEAGVDEMRWDNLHENAQIWPDLAAVRAYRMQVYNLVKQIILTHPALSAERLPITQASPMWALVMGFEHERIHFETSSVLVRELPIELVRVPAEWPELAVRNAHSAPAAASLLDVAAGSVLLGKPAAGPGFGWDNEYGSETRHVAKFAAGSTLVSNGEYLDFVRAGGYATDRFWSRDGLEWRRFRNVKRPAFWVATGPDGSHQYALRTIFEEIEFAADWPVCVNYFEAKAYCAWRTELDDCASPYRVTTEAEQQALRAGWQSAQSGTLAFGSEHSVHTGATSTLGFRSVFGNVWQWTEDHFHPLPGSEPHRYYADFSTPCYDGKHHMMLGGSFVSAGDEASAYARFHFRPHFLQHAGFRLARSLEGNPSGNPKRLSSSGAGLYETDEMLNKYLLMHFGTDAEMYDASIYKSVKLPEVVHLPKVCAELVLQHTQARARVLDLGCAVGRSAFELARHFSEVLGIDYSHEFIDAAARLQQRGSLAYHRKDSGNTGAQLVARIDADIDRTRIAFEQGDACALRPSLGGFDAVLLANVLCRLPEPLACLRRLAGPNGLVRPGGTLVMTTPLSWLAEYTSPNNWLNGLEAVRAELPEFELIEQRELPFLIREHRRKFEYIVTQATVWRRKVG